MYCTFGDERCGSPEAPSRSRHQPLPFVRSECFVRTPACAAFLPVLFSQCEKGRNDALFSSGADQQWGVSMGVSMGMGRRGFGRNTPVSCAIWRAISFFQASLLPSLPYLGLPVRTLSASCAGIDISDVLASILTF